MIMTNGVGATIDTLAAQPVVNRFVYIHSDGMSQIAGWQTSWLIFSAYSLVVAVLFAILFKNRYVQTT